MSCFTGNFTSLPGVRCDRFDSLKSEGRVVAADQFFLSHCHTDHMVGIDTLAMFLRKKALGNKINHRLYCSQISKKFIRERYHIPEKTLYVLNNNDPKTIPLYDGDEFYYLQVTALPANHCPGSVMFLFERLEGERGSPVVRRILYTGDFRFDQPSVPFHCPDLSRLHDCHGLPLALDELYLDTTFCSPLYRTFPTREEAQEKIWDLCDKWIRKNGLFKQCRSKHVILFVLPAKYGYEGILGHVYQKSRHSWRVHVSSAKFSEYLCNSELAQCTDEDPAAAQWLHACQMTGGKRMGNQPMLKTLPCQAGDFEVCQIRPSAMFFTQKKMAEQVAAGRDRVVSVSQGGSNYRVCYSTHSSMEELERFVKHFAEDRTVITPCAIPVNSSKEDVKKILASWLKSGETVGVAGPGDSSSQESDTSLSLSPHRPTEPVRPEPDMFSSPCQTKDRKRKSSSSDSSQPTQQKLLKLEAWDSSSRISFDDTMDVVGKHVQGEPDSSEEEEAENNRFSIDIVPSPVGETSSSREPGLAGHSERRKTFARSKSEKTCCSMPIPVDEEFTYNPSLRRKSEPSDLKMPVIKVTPSSPSPDPNHPDYPEFFEDPLYLKHIASRGGNRSQSRRRSSCSVVGGDFDNFTLVLEEGVSDCDEGEDVEMKEEEVVHDTPELHDILEEAVQSNLEEAGSVPDEVIKMLKQDLNSARPLAGKWGSGQGGGDEPDSRH